MRVDFFICQFIFEVESGHVFSAGSSGNTHFCDSSAKNWPKTTQRLNGFLLSNFRADFWLS